ncbi:MAG: LON peptidase substrate-binding domain-containing protein [Isosphaeraceae bacterium]
MTRFNNRCLLFPLPELVFFPHSVLPLHIFEPRYRQMTEDALAGDRLVTMVQIRPVPPGSTWTEPVPIMDVGCLGEVIRHERLDDGRFNFLLLGRHRVRLLREVPSPKLYRIAEAEILHDQKSDRPPEPRRRKLVERFRAVIQKDHQLSNELDDLLKSVVPLGILSDVIAHALYLPAATKQRLLAETQIDRRIEMLQTILRDLDEGQSSPMRSFPPPFGLN